MDHLAQLQHLIPDILACEWVHLPTAAHSTRTEPQLVLTLGGRARDDKNGASSSLLQEQPDQDETDSHSALTAIHSPRNPSGMASSPPALETAREELQGALARHLLESYVQHLERQALSAEDPTRTAEVRAAMAEVVPPFQAFQEPFPEGAPDVPLAELPPRPDPPSRFATPQRGPGAATPDTALRRALTAGIGRLSTARKPPVHPGSTAARTARQRRLSFSVAEESTLDKLHAALQSGSVGADDVESIAMEPASPSVCRRGGALSATRDNPVRICDQEDTLPSTTDDFVQNLSDGFETIGSILSPEEFDEALASSSSSQDDDSDLLSSMPPELRRRSVDGIVSVDALRRLSSNEDRHRRLSGAQAVADREASAITGSLPRLMGRLQRLFGTSGPRAMTRATVLDRLRRGEASDAGLDMNRALEALAKHAPGYLELNPFGSCGKPAVWINRGADTQTIMARLTRLAEQRHGNHD